MSQTDSAHEARLLSLPRRDQSYGSVTDDDHSSPRQGARSVSVGSSTENDNSTRRRRRVKLPKVNLSLVNSGSVARDHLASERTFLAYVRTSLAISSMGVALVQLFRISPVPGGSQHHLVHAAADLLGATLILTGLLTLVIGLTRFFAVQNALLDGKYPASRGIVLPAIILVVTYSIVFGISVSFRTNSPH